MMKPRLLAAILSLTLLALTGGVSPAWGIVNGGSAAFADYPFMVSLRLTSTPDRHYCGGTLIAPNLVLTAAHCVQDEHGTRSDLVAVVGVDTIGWEYAPRVEVVDMVHGPPLGATNVDDIAVLRLATEQLTPTVRLATTEPSTGTQATALGWGSSGKPSPPTLQLVTQKVSKDATCAELMPFTDAATSLCATSLRSGTESGDSGGPLIVWDKKTGEPVQVGVLSIGNNDEKKYVDAYQSVAVQAEWIRQASSHLNQLRITEAVLPPAEVGGAYATDLNAYVVTGTAPVTWSLMPGSTPGWFLTDEGLVTGTPTSPGDVTLNVLGVDARGTEAHAAFTFRVATSTTDGSIDPATIIDPVLRACISQAAGVTPGAPIPADKLASLGTLSCNGRGVRTLDGMPNLPSLTELDLGWNQLTSLSGMPDLTNLASLQLGGNQLTSLADLPNYAHLTELLLVRNQLTSLSGMPDLTNLTSLQLAGNQLTSLTGMPDLTNLTSLGLSSNQLTNLTGMPNLTRLTHLALYYNELTTLTGMPDLTTLTILSLNDNQLTSLTGMPNAPGLTELGLSGNQLTDLAGIPNAPGLTYLSLSNNQLTSLTGLPNLTGLISLSLDGNQLTDLTGMPNATVLTELSLHDNQLTSLTGMSSLTGLTYLRLENNQLTSLTGMPDAPLIVLYASGNKLNSLTGLANLTELRGLYLDGNELTSLAGMPNPIGLNALSLGANQLTSVNELPALPGLKFLGLTANQITLVAPLASRTQLWGLNLYGNPITDLETLQPLVTAGCSVDIWIH